MLNEISEINWKSELKKINKKQEKDREVYQILDMFINVMTTMFQRIMNDENIDEIYRSMIELKTYTNKSLTNVYNRFKNVVLRFNDDWSIGKIK